MRDFAHRRYGGNPREHPALPPLLGKRRRFDYEGLETMSSSGTNRLNKEDVEDYLIRIRQNVGVTQRQTHIQDSQEIPILENFDDILVPPGKSRHEIVSQNRLIGKMYFPQYRPNQRYPDLIKFRREFSDDENTLIDALWWNVKNRLWVEFKQNLVAVARFMRIQRLAVTQLSSTATLRPQTQTYAQILGESSKTRPTDNFCYQKKTFKTKIVIPFGHNNLPLSEDLQKEANNIIDHFNMLLSEITGDALMIRGFLKDVPKIYFFGKAELTQITLADYGFIGLVQIKNVEDSIALGKIVHEYIKKVEDFLPLFARIYQIAPSSCRGMKVEGFRLIRFSNYSFEDVEILSDDETKDLTVDKSKLQIAQAMETIEIMELLTNQDRWYTVYNKEDLIIQADEPFNGRLKKESKDMVEIALPSSIRVVGLINEYFNNTLPDKDKAEEDTDGIEKGPTIYKELLQTKDAII